MTKNPEFSKSNVFPNISLQKQKRKSVQLSLDLLGQLVKENNPSVKSKIKNVEGNKFKNIPKNKKLSNLTFVLLNKSLQSQNKNKDYYLNLINKTDENQHKEMEKNIIRKKMNEMNEMDVKEKYDKNEKNEKNVKKRVKIRGQTIKEKNDIISVLKKTTKIKRKRKSSYNRDDKVSKSNGSKRKKRKQCSSSNSMINLKNNKNKAKEMDNIRHIINAEEKVKKIYIKKEENNENEENSNKETNKENEKENNKEIENKIEDKKEDNKENIKENIGENNLNRNKGIKIKISMIMIRRII